MVLQRERLHALIDERLPGAVWLHGPTGAGKTLLLRSYLQRHGAPTLWLTADESHCDPAALFAALAAIAAPHGDGPLPTFSPEHRDAPTAFADGFFARLDQALPDGCALVVDDTHHLVGSTAPLLACAIDRFGGRRRLCFASQLMPDAAFAPQLAGSRLWIVGHRQLAFDRDEAHALATRLGTFGESVDALVGATDGWAAGLMLAMQFGASGGSGASDDPLETVRTPLALLIAGQVLGGVPRDDLVRLRLLAELPQVPMELADVAPAWASACARLQSLSERGLFVERLVADRRQPASEVPSSKVMRITKGCWRLHDLFRNAVREPGAIGPPDPTLGDELVAHLLTLERLDLAWQLAARLGPERLDAVVASHGREALRDVHLLGLLQMAQPHADRSAPSIAIWHARGLIGNDNAAALRACDEAHAGFDARGDADGVALAAALALFVVFATIENVGEMATWAERFGRIVRSAALNVDGDERQAIRVAGEVVHDLLVGGRSQGHEVDGELQDRLMQHMTGQALSPNETILGGSLLIAAMRRANRVHEVERAILRVEGLDAYRRSAAHIRASWNVENGYHFMRLGTTERAKACFDTAIVLADENALLQPRLAALIGLVRLTLSHGEIRQAEEHLAALDAVGQDRMGRQRGWVLHLRARLQALAGRHREALGMIDRADELIAEAGFPASTTVILDQDRFQLLFAAGESTQSLELADAVIARASRADARRIENTRGLLRVQALWDVDRAQAQSLLRTHLEAARLLNQLSFVNLLPDAAAQLAARALQLGIETAFVARAIRVRNLSAPRDAPGTWPWPVRIEVLRPFRIVRDGRPVESSGKAQQKPLELLKYLACTRDLIADATSIAAALWPDGEEGAARKSLEVTVSRLRRLLEDDTLVLVKEGKVALDPKRVSTDARQFALSVAEAEAVMAGGQAREQVAEAGDRLLDLFVELPLEHEEPTAWREAVRERYRTAFVRAARALIAYWQRAGDPTRAAALIEAALGREPLAENLYRLLMQHHLDAGNDTEAMRVYRQCRQMLSVLIGAQPSAETERLRTLIKL